MSVLKTLLGNNYLPALGLLAGLVMALGYQHIVQNNGHCPMVLATGGLSCGKTTSLMSVLSTIGNHKSGNNMCVNEIYGA